MSIFQRHKGAICGIRITENSKLLVSSGMDYDKNQNLESKKLKKSLHKIYLNMMKINYLKFLFFLKNQKLLSKPFLYI